MTRKHLTVEAEQDIHERIAQHNENLYGWLAGGWLVPTEPDPEERAKTVSELFGARDELIRLLVKWCDADEEWLLQLTIGHCDGQGIVAVGPRYRVSKRQG